MWWGKTRAVFVQLVERVFFPNAGAFFSPAATRAFTEYPTICVGVGIL